MLFIDFHDTDLVIAEKPEYGNATYLVKGEWEEVKQILKLSRWEARTRYREKVRRVIHHDEKSWMVELKSIFNHWK